MISTSRQGPLVRRLAFLVDNDIVAFAIVFGLPLFLVVVTVVGTYQQYDRVRSWGGLLLLFLNRHHALIIPRRCLGERDAEIREYIASKLRRAV